MAGFEAHLNLLLFRDAQPWATYDWNQLVECAVVEQIIYSLPSWAWTGHAGF